MSRGSFEHMLAVIEKKPRLKEIYDNIEKYTDEEIDAMVDVPSWIKKHFKKVTFIEDQKNSMSVAQAMAAILYDKYPRKPTPTYKYYEYKGMSKTLSSGTELYEGELVSVISDCVMKIGLSCIKPTNKEMSMILSQSSYIGEADVHEYGRLVQENIEKRHGLFVSTSVDYSNPMRSFRIQRG